MSKRFKGKDCAYCGVVGGSETADHVFAREFFLPELRANLPKVPACSACNGAKSILEHYLTTVLPFAGNHPASIPLLRDQVPRRLAKNRKLWDGLAAGRETVDVVESGVSREAMAFPFEFAKLIALIEFITRGLSFHHWGVVIPADHTVKASAVNPHYEPILTDLFRAVRGGYARGGPGNYSFRYEGRQFIEHPALTLWRFQIYNGIQLTGDARVPDAVGSTLWACTTPPGIDNLLTEPE